MIPRSMCWLPLVLGACDWYEVFQRDPPNLPNAALPSDTGIAPFVPPGAAPAISLAPDFGTEGIQVHVLGDFPVGAFAVFQGAPAETLEHREDGLIVEVPSLPTGPTIGFFRVVDVWVIEPDGAETPRSTFGLFTKTEVPGAVGAIGAVDVFEPVGGYWNPPPKTTYVATVNFPIDAAVDYIEQTYATEPDGPCEKQPFEPIQDYDVYPWEPEYLVLDSLDPDVDDILLYQDAPNRGYRATIRPAPPVSLAPTILRVPSDARGRWPAFEVDNVVPELPVTPRVTAPHLDDEFIPLINQTFELRWDTTVREDTWLTVLFQRRRVSGGEVSSSLEDITCWLVDDGQHTIDLSGFDEWLRLSDPGPDYDQILITVSRWATAKGEEDEATLPTNGRPSAIYGVRTIGGLAIAN